MDLVNFLFFLSFFAQLPDKDESVLILLNSTLTWTQARDRCREELSGHLISLDEISPDKKVALKSCVNEDINIWYGHYTEPTPWISMDGCVRFDCDNLPVTYTMQRSTPFDCLELCNVTSDAPFAVKERSCVCDSTEIRRIGYLKNDSMCNIPCDDSLGYCGGDSSYTVYRLAPPVGTYKDDEECAFQKCNSEPSTGTKKIYKVQLQQTNCDTRNIYPMCRGNEKLDVETSWTNGIKECLKQYDEYMAGHDISESKCHFTDNKYNIRYWANVFRSSYVRQDTGNKTADGQTHHPFKIGSFSVHEISIGLKLVSNSEETKAVAVCETDAHRRSIELRNDSVVCDFHIITTPVQISRVEYMLPQKQNDSINFIIIFVVSGVLIVTVVIIIACILWRRRKRRDRQEVDQSTDSRQTVELIAKQFKELNSNDVKNGGYRVSAEETHLKSVDL